MQNMPVWGKILVVVGLCVAILMPLALFALNNPMIATLLSRGSKVPSKRYSVQSEVPGYSLKLADTNFLDFSLSKMNIFGVNAIADPRFYQGYKDSKLRSTVSGVRFILVSSVDHPVSIVVRGDGRTSPLVIVGQGSYSIEDQMLVVRVALNFDALAKPPFSGKFTLEDAYLQTALNTVYYAQGISAVGEDQKAIPRIKLDMEEYLYKGFLQWPYRIDRK